MDTGCLRRAWRPGRRPGEPWLDWERRTRSGSKALALRLGMRTLLEEVLVCQHRWAGHVARLPDEHVVKVLSLWRAECWWVPFRAKMLREDPRNATRWAHPRTGGQNTRWDHQLCKYHGHTWHEQAWYRDRWALEGEHFVLAAYNDLTRAPNRYWQLFLYKLYHMFYSLS